MKKKSITIRSGDKLFSCTTAILVPEIAISESGHIKTISCNSGTEAKHEFYALAQFALIRFQDEELDVNTLNSPVQATWNGETIEITSGLVICRNLSGNLEVLVHPDTSLRRLLESAHRFCTRWIRLDI